MIVYIFGSENVYTMAHTCLSADTEPLLMHDPIVFDNAKAPSGEFTSTCAIIATTAPTTCKNNNNSKLQ